MAESQNSVPRKKYKPIPQMTVKDIERFRAKIDTSGGPDACHPWTGATNRGYGVFQLATHLGKNRSNLFRAIRVAFFIANGKDAEGEVCHLCNNSICLNANHFMDGTHAINMQHHKESGNALRAQQYRRGENCETAILTNEQALEIRRTYVKGSRHGFSSVALAKKYCVSHQTILDVVHRVSFKHI